MGYKLSATINTKDKEFHQDFPHIFHSESALVKAIAGGLRAGRGVITSTVLTIVHTND